MRAFTLLMLATVLMAAGCNRGTRPASAPADIAPSPAYLLGTLEYNDILATYPEWQRSHAAVAVEDGEVDALRAVSEPLTIECYLGTWCSDSRDGVPVVVKSLRAADNPAITLELIGVDRDKVDPEFRAPAHAIDRVPTFILYREGVEIARLIEFPVGEDFVADILASLP